MKTETQPLPEHLEQFRQRFIPLREAKARLDREIEENRRKLADAIQERKELEQSGPPDGENDRKLGEAIIRVQLFQNHQTKLDARAVELTEQAVMVTTAFSRELQKIGLKVQGEARAQLCADVGRLCVNVPIEVTQALSGSAFTTPLRSREEECGRVLKLRAEFHRGDGDPFTVFAEMVEAWEEFVAALTQAQAAKREPITA